MGLSSTKKKQNKQTEKPNNTETFTILEENNFFGKNSVIQGVNLILLFS